MKQTIVVTISARRTPKHTELSWCDLRSRLAHTTTEFRVALPNIMISRAMVVGSTVQMVRGILTLTSDRALARFKVSEVLCRLFGRPLMLECISLVIIELPHSIKVSIMV